MVPKLVVNSVISGRSTTRSSAPHTVIGSPFLAQSLSEFAHQLGVARAQVEDDANSQDDPDARDRGHGREGCDRTADNRAPDAQGVGDDGDDRQDGSQDDVQDYRAHRSFVRWVGASQQRRYGSIAPLSYQRAPRG